MLRDLSKKNAQGHTICGTNKVGVLASELPTGFPMPGLLNNDVSVNDPAGCLYRVDFVEWPTSGTFTAYENGAFSLKDAVDGTQTLDVIVYKNDVPDAGTVIFNVGDNVVTPAPTGTITLQPTPDGQSQRFVGTTLNATGGTYTLTGSQYTVGPLSFSAAGSFDFTVTDLEPDTYSVALTLTGAGGMGVVSGTSNFSLMGITGGGSLVLAVTPPPPPETSPETDKRAVILIDGVPTTLPNNQLGTGKKPVVYLNGKLQQRIANEGTPVVKIGNRYRLLKAGDTLEI